METGTCAARSATARLKEKDSTAAGPAPRPPLSTANAAAPPPIEFTGREDVDALLDEKMEGTKFKGKAVVMSEYIPKLQACIKYLLEREVVNLAEISKLNGLVDAADESTYGQRTAAGPAPRPPLSTASQNAVAPPPTVVSIEFAGREDVDALLDKKFKRRNYSGKGEEMSEYIKKGCACIKWLLEREDANLVEIEKLNGLIDAADKHRPEIELESKVEESVAMKEELQRGESLKMLQEYNTSLQQYNCHLQADAIKSAETIGKLQKENNAKAAEINLLLIRLGAYKELAGKCSTELENAIIQCASLEETCSKQDETIKLLQFQVAQNEKERLKSDKCPMAWSSVESINQEELHQKLVQSDNFEQVLDTETDQLRKVSQNYENDKKLWAAAISNLESKIKAMKQEQALLSLEAHKFAQVIPDPSKMIEAVRALVAQCDDLKVKYHEEVAKRKKLHNIVQEIKGNIRVFCRCRPLSKVEKSSGFKGVVDFDGANDGEIGIMTGGTGKKIFTFDRVYTPKDDNAEVYADASPLVTSVLDGYNVCIFAYGQTGSGKTFTMEGTEGNRGVNYKTLEELFKIAEERKHTVRHDMYVSVLEVYNEQIRDLLATSSSSKNLEIKQAGEGSHHVPGIVEAKVQNIKEVWDVLQTGSTSRAVASNNVNERSSRSHCMLCIMVTAKNLINGDCTKSKLCLVDLAGSERLTKTDPQGDRLKEAVNINKSLSALGDVISALASRSSHIPYRNSKLTQLLQDFLGGDSKALMFVQISPSENDSSETLSSLNFASRVHGIELGPAKKQVDTSEFQKVKQLERSKQKFRTLEDNCKNLENKAKGKEQLYKKWQEEIVELERKLQQQHRLDSEIAALKQSIEERELKLKEQEQQRSAAESNASEMEQELLEAPELCCITLILILWNALVMQILTSPCYFSYFMTRSCRRSKRSLQGGEAIPARPSTSASASAAAH